jgi:putative membrane protein
MEFRARDHVPALTGLLSAISLALVFGAVLGALPAGTLPRAPAGVVDAIPQVNAAVSLVAIGTIATAWRAIRRGNVERHRALMLTSLVLFVAFLALYLYKVALEGPAPFPGPETIYQFVYLPVLGIHITLAIVCVPLLYYVLLLALTRPIEELPRTNHRRVGRVAASLWLVSFALGVVVYTMLYVVY